MREVKMLTRVIAANDCSIWAMCVVLEAVEVRSFCVAAKDSDLCANNDILAGALPDTVSIREVVGHEINDMPEDEALFDLWVTGGVIPGMPEAEKRFVELLSELTGGLAGMSVIVVENQPRFTCYVEGYGSAVVCRRVRLRYVETGPGV
jgi:hypothetical protein